MQDNTSFAGSIPEYYDRYMGPVMFEPYARDIAQRAAATGARQVLECACGSGIVTRALRTALAPDAALVASDLAPAMLQYAQAHVGPLPNTHWQVADLTALPFDTASFEAVVCQFGVMFPSDKPALFGEVRRVLRPRGHWIFNVWDTLAANPFAAAVHRTIGAMSPSDPPQFFTVPFAFSDHDVLRGLLRDHDFTDITLETIPLIARSSSALALATGMVRGSPVASALTERGLDLDAVILQVTEVLATLGGRAPFESPMQAVVCTARAG